MGFQHCFILLGLIFYQEHFVASVTKAPVSENSCFCKLEGVLEDCPCTAVTIDQFNSQLHTNLLRLLETEYFRYFQVDFDAPCKWGWDTQCSSPNCAVDTCNEEDLPEGLKNYLSSLKTVVPQCSSSADPYPEHHDVVKMKGEQQFCKLDPLTNPEKCAFVDLLQNPEKFTGYSGEAAHRVWNTIYNEMCFHPEVENKTLYLTSSTAKTMCLEKRAFYKLVSGLHSSITVHLCSRYLLKEGEPHEEVWGRNFMEFKHRFSPSTTNNEGPERLKNIYFLYLVELRALHKVAPLLEGLDDKNDAKVNYLLKETLRKIDMFPSHFNESEFFQSESLENMEILNLYKQNFMEISEIMDCLSCERCKVWGKLQVTGVGTALKVLFTPLESLVLTKHEIVALFNAFGRHSTSIKELEEFRAAEGLQDIHVVL